MSMSLTALSHAIHGLTHKKTTHPHATAGQPQQFGQQATAALGQGKQPSGAASGGPGGLLSADMLQVMQTIG